MFEVVVQTGFAAAHNLRGYQGECEKLHGHNWKVDVYIRGEQLDEVGMLVDFRAVKEHINAVLDQLDHEYLNEMAPFDAMNPTTENLARYVAETLAERLPEGVSVNRVTAWESEHCGATYWLRT